MEDLAKASLSCLFCIAESTCGCLTIIFGYWTIEENWKRKRYEERDYENWNWK